MAVSTTSPAAAGAPSRAPAPAAKIRNAFATLADLATPRPFVWYQFVQQRRGNYTLGCIVAFALFMLLLSYCLGQVGANFDNNRLRPYWIAVFFGALVLLALMRYTYVLERLWNTSRWLSRYGHLAEANVLWVVATPQRLVLAYRFWTSADKEIVKETVIDADGPYPLTDLTAGDLIPVLYDPRRPRQRSMIWAEIERYVALREKRPANSPAT